MLNEAFHAMSNACSAQRDFERGLWEKKQEYCSHGVRSAWRNQSCSTWRNPTLFQAMLGETFFETRRHRIRPLRGGNYVKKQSSEGQTLHRKSVSKPCGNAPGAALFATVSLQERYRCEPRWNTSTQTSSSSSRPSSEVLWFFPAEEDLLLEDQNFESLEKGKRAVVISIDSVFGKPSLAWV